MSRTTLKMTFGLLVVFILCGSGCNTNKAGERIAMLEGTLCVKNDSKVDVFPVVKAKSEEDFGGVSAGSFAVIGFAAIDVDKAARVVWAEGKWDDPARTVVFRLRTTAQITQKTKYLEFCYHGNGQWFLNLFDGNPRRIGKLLLSIPGQVE